MPKLTISNAQASMLKDLEEHYNALSANIRLSGEDNKIIAVTSVQPGEGKSTTSINLAATLAKMGFRTLLVDADTRNSVMSGTFRTNDKISGLTAFLSGTADLDSVLCTTDIENLYVIPSGPVPPNPTTLLQSKNFSNTLGVLRKYYDYIIIDTPPVGLVIDAVLVAQESDAIMLVTATGVTKRRDVQKAKEQLEHAKAQFLGVVLNKYDVKADSYGAYGAYGSYGDYGKKK